MPKPITDGLFDAERLRIIAKRVKALRRLNRWTQLDLEVESEVDIRTIKSIESGKKVSSESYEAVARALDTNYLFLISVEREKLNDLENYIRGAIAEYKVNNIHVKMDENAAFLINSDKEFVKNVKKRGLISDGEEPYLFLATAGWMSQCFESVFVISKESGLNERQAILFMVQFFSAYLRNKFDDGSDLNGALEVVIKIFSQQWKRLD